MAESRTQDNQKVFNSASDKFKSFLSGVSPNSSAKNMELIYQNMEKLFDVFTQGVLLGQGANSEYILRTIYRSIGDDFLKIFQDSDSVDKIVDVLKQKQGSISPSEVQDALVSNTTKKVITKTLDPNDCDPLSVVLDFNDEIQQAVLQVKLNLNREYERRKIQYSKSYQGQQEDFEKLKQEFHDQDNEVAQKLKELGDSDEKWKQAQIDETKKMVGLFEGVSNLNKSIDLKRIISDIQNPQTKVSTPGQDISKYVTEIGSELSKIENEQKKEFNENPFKGISSKNVEKPESPSFKETFSNPIQKVLKPETQILSAKGLDIKGLDTKVKVSPALVQTKLLSKQTDASHSVGQKQSLIGNKPQSSQGGKMDWILLPGGKKKCPFCGSIFSDKGKQYEESQGSQLSIKPKISNVKQKIPQKPSFVKPIKGVSQISEQGVTNQISKLSQGISDILKDDAFKRNFMLDYPQLQKHIGLQMDAMDKDEQSAGQDLNETEKNVKKMKKPGGGLLKSLIFGGFNIVFIAIGGILLITLARIALSVWSKNFMPKQDGSTFSLFGMEIPGFEQIKAIGLGIYNTIIVGLPNMWDRLKLFFGKIHKQLFGSKGMFKDATETKNTLRKLVGAYLIGIAKKVAASGPMGWLWKGLGFLLGLIPGAGPFLQFLCKFVPELISFISMQIMLHWSNKKAQDERDFKDLTKNYSSKDLSGMFKTAGEKVKPFVPPTAIPGLETPRRKGGKVEVRGAIMRHTSIGVANRSNRAEKIQDITYEKDIKEGEESDQKRYVYDESKKNDKWTLLTQAAFTGGEMEGLSEEEAGKNRLRIYNKVISPQLNKLDQYILALSKSKRFQGIKGPLYDINTGWNPGYRMRQYDLMSPIPLTPFEDIHSKNDVSIGTPSGEDEDWIGFLPFTWEQKGAVVTANPIQYELKRAQKIRELWVELWRDIEGYGQKGNWFTNLFKNNMESPQEAADKVLKSLLPKYSEKWRKANYITQGGYGKDVLYGDKFINFYRKFQKGEIDHKDNNLEGVENTNRGFFGKAWEATKVGGVPLGVAGWAINGLKALSGMAFGSVKKKVDNAKRVLGYGKDSNLAKSGILGKVASSALSAWDLYQWRKTKFHGMSYGDVRDFMLDTGIMDWFSQGRILGPIGKAETLVDLLRRKKPSPFSEFSDSDHPWLYSLVWKVLSSHGITPPDGDWNKLWKSLDQHKEEQAGFAQSLLEYFIFRVMPAWNRTESLLHTVFSFNGSKEIKDKWELKLTNQIFELLKLFKSESIVDFIYSHLRFPNMKVKVIDYSNAESDEDIRKLDYFKKKMGFLDEKEKKSFFNLFQKMGTPNESDKIMDQMKKLASQIRKEEFEARFTGASRDRIQSMKDKLESLKQAYRNAKQKEKSSGNTNIVRNLGKVVKIVEPPPKSPEEIQKEEEQRRKEEEARAAAEAEAKRKEEERKAKELEEKKKRAEEVAVAEAKIKAMEAIRKQEQKYETLLEKMVGNPGSVTDEELKSLGDDVNNLKQEAENRINQLPREERELKLALIRGDKISAKTFQECKETAVGLHSSLQNYIEEVNQIPSGSIMAVDNSNAGGGNPIPTQDPDEIDMGD